MTTKRIPELASEPRLCHLIPRADDAADLAQGGLIADSIQLMENPGGMRGETDLRQTSPSFPLFIMRIHTEHPH
jgi:hypothetical protein